MKSKNKGILIGSIVLSSILILNIATFSVAYSLYIKEVSDVTFTFRQAISKNVTFYTAYSEGEWGSSSTVVVPANGHVDAGDIPSISLSGYTFEGWVNDVPSASNVVSPITNEQLVAASVTNDIAYYPVLKLDTKKVFVNSNYYAVDEDVILETDSLNQTLIGYPYLGIAGIPNPSSSWNDNRNIYTDSGIYKFYENDGAALISRKIGFKPNASWGQDWGTSGSGFGIYSWSGDNNSSIHMGNSNGQVLFTYIPADYDNFKFSRYSSDNNTFTWGNESGNFTFSSSVWADSSTYSKDTIILSMISWGEWVNNWGSDNATWSEPGRQPSDPVLATQPDNDIHATTQYNYLKDPDWTSINTYKPTLDNVDESKPRAIDLDFSDVATRGDTTYYVELSKYSDLSNSRILTTTTNSLSWNPEIGVTYYYRVATNPDYLAHAATKTKYVYKVTPRNLDLGGLRNVRDIGGWSTSLVPNGVIKQGLYFRGAQFNSGNYGATLTFSDADLAEVQRLGIKVDIDMRNTNKQPSGNYSPASTDAYPISIVKATMPDGSEKYRFDQYATEWCNIFNAIANADNEHVYLHCTYGADRTGIASFALLALLGVDVEDIGRDYEFTRFDGQRGVNHAESDSFDSWVSKTNEKSGDCFANKMKTHLMSKGLSEHTLEHIREIFIDGYVAQA